MGQIRLKGKTYNTEEPVILSYNHAYGGAEYGQADPSHKVIELAGFIIGEEMLDIVGQFTINPKSLEGLPEKYWPGNAFGYQDPYETGTRTLQNGTMRIPEHDIVSIDQLARTKDALQVPIKAPKALDTALSYLRNLIQELRFT